MIRIIRTLVKNIRLVLGNEELPTRLKALEIMYTILLFLVCIAALLGMLYTLKCALDGNMFRALVIYICILCLIIVFGLLAPKIGDWLDKQNEKYSNEKEV